MKQHLLLIVSFCILFSCQKEVKNNSKAPDYFDQVINSLHDSLPANIYSTLDLSKAIRTKEDDGKMLFRIFVKNKKLSEEFILVETNNNGNILRGRYIKLQREDAGSKQMYKGNIAITSLNGSQVITSEITNGYIKAFHPDRTTQKVNVVPTPESNMPEVVVTCYINSGGVLYSDWMNLLAMFGGESNYYSFMPLDEGGGWSHGGGSSSGGNGGSTGGGTEITIHSVTDDQPIFVDFEDAEDNPAVDIDKYLKCFANIPNAGSTCSIEILTDIPVDSDPNKFFNWQTASPGHTFLQIKKTNGNQEVMQNIGFYPVNGYKTMLTPGPIEGKIVDNGGHEFNASLLMNITPDQLEVTLNTITLLKYMRYDIDDYNCTDFALAVFNKSRLNNPLVIPKFVIPNTNNATESNTPQGLFMKLKSMQQAGGTESKNINIPRLKGWVAPSKGSCN